MYPFISFLGKEIPTYGICMLLGISAVVLLSSKRAKLYGLVIEDLFIIGAFSLLFALPCASIVFAIATYGITGFFENIEIGNFKIFKGLVFYGGFIGGILGGVLGIKVANVKIISAENTILPFIPLGHSSAGWAV